MKKIGRVLLWICGGALALGCVFFLALNLYVQSQQIHHRIQQELSQRLGTPLRLRRISITPWGGLKLNGITIPQEDLEMAGDFLQARSFQLRVEFLSLFRDRLVIREVSLIKPNVLWKQNSAGKWRLPQLVTPASPPPAPALSVPNESIPLTSPAQPPAPSTAAPIVSPNEQRMATPEMLSFTPEVRRVDLRDGDFTFLDAKGRIVARFDGLNFSSGFRTGAAVKGSTKIEKLSLADRFFIEKLDSPLHYDPTSLAFSSISARCAGGTLSGNFNLQLQTADSPFRASIKFRDIDSGKLLANAGGPSGTIEGRLEGSLDASGKTADPQALTGRGEVFLRNGKVQQYSLLVALGQILQIDELTQLQLQQAEMHFRISPGVVTIDELLLRSPNIRLSATGTLNFSGKLHLQAQLALNDKIRAQLFVPIRENFQPVAYPPGYAAVAFTVGGTIDRPRTNLMDKVVGHDLHDLGGILSNLFGPRPKKKTAPASTPAASPNESPVLSPNESSSPSPSP